MKNLLHLLLAASVILFAGCGGHSDSEDDPNKSAIESTTHMRLDGQIEAKAKAIFKPISGPIESEENPVTEAKVKLGKVLYFDKRLSKDGNISCNSCHDLANFGVDNLPVSPGDDGTLGTRNSPTVLNAAFHTSQFWDGRAKDVEEQAGMPILNPVEMAIPDEAFLVNRLKGIELYKGLFKEAYPEQSSPITYSNLRKAIAVFERTLVTPTGFDDYLNGESRALTVAQKEGLKTFMDVGCITCHTGSMVGGNMFQKFGVHYEYWHATGSKVIDEGRFAETKNEADKYMFKVPSLRNVEKTGPYFHDGSVTDLEQAISIMADVNLNKKLSETEVRSIATFLKSLTGELPADVVAPPTELAASQP